MSQKNCISYHDSVERNCARSIKSLHDKHVWVVVCRLAKPYPIAAEDLDELQNTVYRVFNQSAIVLPGGLLGNASSLQAATQPASGG